VRLRSPGSIFILVCLSCFTSVVHAQAGKAELTGAVRDQNGAIVAQSRVVVTEVATAQNYSTTVTDSGDYTLTNLKPGAYTVSVEADGFRRFVRDGVRLATGERVRVDVVLCRRRSRPPLSSSNGCIRASATVYAR
jgi:hypothetical protein